MRLLHISYRLELVKMMLHYHLFLILILSISLNYVICANILFISPVLSPSHHLWNRILALELVNKRHNLTLIGLDKETLVDIKNYSTILLEDVYDEIYKSVDLNEMADYNPLQRFLSVNEGLKAICKIELSRKGLQQLLNYPTDFKFDLILYDVTMGDWCLSPIIKRFNSPPIIGVTAFLLPPYLSVILGNGLFPSYIPSYNLPYSNQMTFIERLTNSIYTRFNLFVHNHLINPQLESIVKEKFGNDLPSWQHLNERISLLLANTDPLLDYSQPLPPNIIPVGGLHTGRPKKIPEEFQTILDKAENGVVLFSLGTNIHSDKLSENLRKSLLEAFSRLNETVIWKFESDLDNLPKNVIIRKWLPQNDILSHPNVKLFIGHGGALSTQEATYHGVPMIAIPFILDQYVNAKRIDQKQLGLMINFNEITANHFYNQIHEVLNNPIYRENMKKTSQRFRDQPQTPLERAIFWIEYILRHGDDDFLSPKAKQMPYYQSAEIDILLFLIVVLLLTMLIFVKICKILFNLVVPKQKIKIN